MFAVRQYDVEGVGLVVFFDVSDETLAIPRYHHLKYDSRGLPLAAVAAHIEARLPDGSGFVLKNRFEYPRGERFSTCSEGWFA